VCLISYRDGSVKNNGPLSHILPENNTSVTDPLHLYISTASLDLQSDAECTSLKNLPTYSPANLLAPCEVISGHSHSTPQMTMGRALPKGTNIETDERASSSSSSSSYPTRKRARRKTNKGSAFPRSRSSLLHRSSPQAIRASARSARKQSTRVNQDTPPFAAANRLKQATDSSPNYNATNANGQFVCQICPTVWNRKQDFERHVARHYAELEAPNGAMLCCGVPLAESKLARYQGRIASGAETSLFYGRQMVGGCGKLFSRPDSLGRHLRNPNNSCVGDLKGDWHPLKKKAL
jgi:hypothetical protein